MPVGSRAGTVPRVKHIEFGKCRNPAAQRPQKARFPAAGECCNFAITAPHPDLRFDNRNVGTVVILLLG